MSDSESSTPSTSRSSSATSSPPSTPPNLHQNTVNPSAKWLVQKFGGTSVGKFAVKIAREVVSNYMDSHKVAIVCSARSGSTKALGTTNLLLQAASQTLSRGRSNSGATTGNITPASGLFGRNSNSPPMSPRSRGRTHSGSVPLSNSLNGFTSITPEPAPPPPFNITVDILCQEHVTAARNTIKDSDILEELVDEIERDCDWLRSFLFASQVIDEVSPRSKDSIIGLGERLSCKFMTAVLRDQGIDAEYVSLDNIVPDTEEDGHESGALSQAFYDRLAIAVAERVRQCENRVPVVTGFFGPVPGSLLTQVGRGYTDLLSALLAVGLEASELQIWKEVDGIFTADPRKVPTARVIPVISPEEAAELTYYGSEVIHPFTMEQVIRRQIPIRIKNVENPPGPGTMIHPDAPAGGEADIINFRTNATQTSPYILSTFSSLSPSGTNTPGGKLPTAVTSKDHIIVLNVNSNRKSVSHGFLARIFSTLDRFGVVVDLISTSEVLVSMAIEDTLGRKNLDRLVKELQQSGTVTIHENMAILSLVGKQMRHSVGIAGRMFTTLGQGNINLEMISQGASEINISCVISAKDAEKALNIIHQSCLQIPPPQGRLGPWLF